MRPLVLCYHAVSDGWPHLLAVSPEDFERQLAAVLDRGYRPVTAREVIAGEGKLLHVTFDDAFVSIRNALPVLERLDVPATVFVCAGFAAEGRPLDIAELAADIRAYPGELRTMSWSELSELAAHPGIEIGSHTVSHAHLGRLGDANLERELGESRQRIEAELGTLCALFAYPFGEQDERVRRAAQSAGYDAAFALQPGPSTWDDRFQLPRVGIWRGEGARVFRLKTSPLGRSRPMSLLRRARNRLA